MAAAAAPFASLQPVAMHARAERPPLPPNARALRRPAGLLAAPLRRVAANRDRLWVALTLTLCGTALLAQQRRDSALRPRQVAQDDAALHTHRHLREAPQEQQGSVPDAGQVGGGGLGSARAAAEQNQPQQQKLLSRGAQQTSKQQQPQHQHQRQEQHQHQQIPRHLGAFANPEEGTTAADALVQCQARLLAKRQGRHAAGTEAGDSGGTALPPRQTPLSLGVPVKKGNEDILGMDVAALVRQVQHLRERNARLTAPKPAAAASPAVVQKTAVVSSNDELVAARAELEQAKVELSSTKQKLEAALRQLAGAGPSRNQLQKTSGEPSEERRSMLAGAAVDGIVAVAADGSPLAVQPTSTAEGALPGAMQTSQGSASAPDLAYRCRASREEIAEYLRYTPEAPCPDDWPLVQRLVLEKGCVALPPRRCRALTPEHPIEPLPLPQALFEQQALEDANVRWGQQGCKSFKCLNARALGQCRQCFNLEAERRRWQEPLRGTLPLEAVLALKNGTLRIGLDSGGGTGSFAARMAEHGVTVMTTATSHESSGDQAGVPYMEAIAARGLIPLHVPHEARLPFSDGVLDLVHAAHSINSLSLEQFQGVLYEWDRVLRAGGILWLEMFHKRDSTMPQFTAALERLGYRRLHWDEHSQDGGKRGIHTFLSCVLERLPVPGAAAPAA